MQISEFLINLADNLISLFTLSGGRRQKNDKIIERKKDDAAKADPDS